MEKIMEKIYDPNGDHIIQLAANDWPQAEKLGVPKNIFLESPEVACPIFGTAKVFSARLIED